MRTSVNLHLESLKKDIAATLLITAQKPENEPIKFEI